MKKDCESCKGLGVWNENTARRVTTFFCKVCGGMGQVEVEDKKKKKNDCSECSGAIPEILNTNDSCVSTLDNKYQWNKIPYGIETSIIHKDHFSKQDDRCHDCGVKFNGYHHRGCDWQICPICGGQRLICEMNGSCDKSELIDLALGRKKLNET